MTPDDKLDELLRLTGGMETRLGVVDVRVEYLSRSDVETRSRVSALERWRWTVAGICICAGALAAPVLKSLGRA